jgi:hypothetical protein
MKISFAGICLMLISAASHAQTKTDFNGNIEQLDFSHQAKGWTLAFQPEQLKAYPVTLDSTVKHEGKYALNITQASDGAEFGVAAYTISHTFEGDNIELKGYLKLQDVVGSAGLWLRVDGKGESIAFDNMQKQALKGTADWKEYSIKLPYQSDKATQIVFGGLLSGSGKIWIDDLRLYINGKPVQEATCKAIKLTKAQTDTAFSKKSGVDTVLLRQQQVKNLAVLGQIWGFVKYHHPAVAKGEVNMDAELFRVMPAILKATDRDGLSQALEQWINSLGNVSGCSNCQPRYGKDVIQKPEYGDVFNPSLLSPSLVAKLRNLLNNHHTNDHYYIDMVKDVGNPVFKNELAYNGMLYPDAGYRLLTLYRYWNMIQYFFPYKHLIGRNWNDVLTEYIPRFTNASNKTDYALTTLALIAEIHDTHAGIWSANAALSDYKGRQVLPFQAKFIEEKLVVTGYYADTLGVKQKFKVGDVITQIDGVNVNQLIKKYLPITPASNYETQLRDMPNAYLLRTAKKEVPLTILHDGQTLNINMATMERRKLNVSIDYNPDPKEPGYKVIDGNIGYVFPAKYYNKDLPQIKKLFAGTKGIIVDMRCYPSEFMPFTFVPYIKTGNAPFVKFTSGSIESPGSFSLGEKLANRGTNDYKGKVVVIVNGQTQSQAEYTTMAFQSSPNVTVIGSTTAGADGNVSSILLPGGISTMISGINVLYPDGTETQRKGVKIDVPLKPTILGIKAGRDELLDKAKEIINSSK